MGAIRTFPLVLLCASGLAVPARASPATRLRIVSHKTSRVVAMIEGALTTPPRIPRLDAVVRLAVTPKGAAIVPVEIPALHADRSFDHQRIAAYLARARELGADPEHAAVSPIEYEEDPGADFVIRELEWLMALEPEIKIPPLAEDLIVRGEPDAERIQRFLDREHGVNRAREILASVSEALAGVPLEKIGAFGAVRLHAAAGRARRGLRRRSGAAALREPRPWNLEPAPSSRGLGSAFARNDRLESRQGEVAAALEADRVQAQIRRSRLSIMTVGQLESAADELLSSLTERVAHLDQRQRRELQLAYDEARRLLYAQRLAKMERMFAAAASLSGLSARRYSSQLGGVLVGAGFGPSPVPALEAEAGARFEAIRRQNIEWYYGRREGGRWQRLHARWERARRFHEPAVSDLAGFAAELAVLGMTGEYDALGVRGFSHRQVIEDARAIFRRHFSRAAEHSDSWRGLERMLRETLRGIPDRLPVRFAMAVAAHLRRAALLPDDQITRFFDAESMPPPRLMEDEQQSAVLRDFLRVADQTLREERALSNSGARVLGLVLTGSFVIGSAREGSDLDIQLITADGSISRSKDFAERLNARWRALGQRNPVNIYHYALIPSSALIGLVHRGPHLIVAPEASFLGAAPDATAAAAIEAGLFEDPDAAGGGLRDQVRTLVGRLIDALEREDGGARPTPPARIAAYFPGLGSLDAYRDEGGRLWGKGGPQVRALYRRAAAALGLGRDGRPAPERLFFLRENIPADPDEAAGFLAAAFLTHNVALAEHMRREGAQARVPVSISAYAGDSLGVLTAAVAGGALSIEDGARIARFLPTAIRRAARAGGFEARASLELEALARPLGGSPFGPIWYGDGQTLGQLILAAQERFGADFQVMRLLPGDLARVHLPERRRHEFEDWLSRAFPLAEARPVAAPSQIVFHSPLLAGVRSELKDMLAGMRVDRPGAPIASNNRSGLITTAAQVRDALLAMVDQPMDSGAMIHVLEQLRPDALVGIGLGGRGQELLERSRPRTPTASFDGTQRRSAQLQESLARGPYWGRPD